MVTVRVFHQCLDSVTCLGDQLIMTGWGLHSVSSRMFVTVQQVSVGWLGFGHFHHVCWTLLTQLRAGTLRAVALLDSDRRNTGRCTQEPVLFGRVCGTVQSWDKEECHILGWAVFMTGVSHSAVCTLALVSAVPALRQPWPGLGRTVAFGACAEHETSFDRAEGR